MNVAARRGHIYEFAKRSFFDVADRDYILARVSFRLELDVQFIALAHQALEKYLKAILLFNDHSTKAVGHDILKAYQLVTEMSEFSIEVPTDVVHFMTDLHRCSSRYFEYSYGVSGRKLFALDRAVWHIRRYCQDWHVLTRHSDGTFSEHLDVRLESVHDDRWLKEPHMFRLFHGVLDDILGGKYPELLEPLVWSNPYYSSFRPIAGDFLRGAFANSTVSLHTEAFPLLDGLVTFSTEFRKQMKRPAPNSP